MIQRGYLAVQTHREHAGLVGVASLDQFPPANGGDSDAVKTWFVVEFDDIEAARMHAHEALKRQSAGTNLFRTDPIQAIAAVDAIILPHRRTYIDVALTAEDHAAIERATGVRLERHRRLNKIGNLAGKLAIGLLAGYLLLTLLLALLR